MKLRDYQERGINDIRAQFSRGVRRVCFVGPCGMGKTVLMAFMSTEAERRGNRTLFLQHRVELIGQSSATLTELNVKHDIIGPGGAGYSGRNITVASVQTLSRRLDKIIEPDVIILDECHHATASSWRKVIDAFPNAYVVGLTATPARLGGQGLGDVFETLVIGPTAKELIQQGHLAPYKYYAPPVVAQLDGLKIKMGDFEHEETVSRVDKPTVIGDAVQHYMRLAAGKRAIAYCASREHSKHTAEAFRQAGVPAMHIDGETPAAERKQALDDFRAGRLTVLSNVDLFGEGVDVPGMECVILLRPTASLTLYIQQSMRGMRPDKSNPFKTAIILDHVGNVFRHGLPDQDREWSLEGVKKRRKASEAGTVSIRQCQNCYSVHAPADKCPYCGYEYPVTVRELEEKAGELKEIVELSPEQKKSKRMEVGMCRTIADLKKVAAERGYAPGWVWFTAKAKGIKH